MGYYNPIYQYGNERFLTDAKAAGVDGLIIVDLPPEADDELCLPAIERGLNFIRLATPTTDDKRLPAVLANTSGFVYYVSITGITGARAPDVPAVASAVGRIKRHTALPVAVGFGVRTPEQAAAIAAGADGVVVGSALVEAVRGSLDEAGRATKGTTDAVAGLVRSLAEGVRASYAVQRSEGMEPLPCDPAAAAPPALAECAPVAWKYCGGGFGGYAVYMFVEPAQRDRACGLAGFRPIEPFIR